MDTERPIHERVREHVDASGLSYAEIAGETGWSEQRVYRLLTGKTALGAEDIEQLARVLNKTVASLYRGRGHAS